MTEETDLEEGKTGEATGKKHDFNMSEEVDRCQLWKHMVHHLDKEPLSPKKSQLRNRSSEGRDSSVAKANLSKKFEEAALQNDQEVAVLTDFLPMSYQSTTV